jgi:integrase
VTTKQLAHTTVATLVRRPPGEVAPAYTEADWQLSPATLARIADAPADNTLRAYRRWGAKWHKWCDDHGRVALPATPQTLANWVTELCEDSRLGMPSLRIAVAAVRFQHALAGYPGEPAGKLAKLVAKSRGRELAVAGKGRVRRATPILSGKPGEPGTLDALLDTCDPDTLRGRRDRFVIVLGWAGMLRRSELAALTMGDAYQAATGIKVYIATSKTDQEGEGETRLIPSDLLGGIDPIPLWRGYLDALAEHGITTGRLFRAISQGGRIYPSISGAGINELIREAAQRAKLPGAAGYTAHSLRAGGATSAYWAGMPVSAIAEHGRWAKNSPVVLGYIRSVDQERDNPMRRREVQP